MSDQEIVDFVSTREAGRKKEENLHANTLYFLGEAA